jgi:hypothetical protein
MTSSARLQHEAEAARADLAHSLDELRGTMTATALTSAGVALAKEGSSALARAAVHRAGANPLAALLIGAGIVLLLSKGSGTANGSNGSTSPGAGHLVDRANQAIKGAATAVGNAVSGGRHAASHAADSARHAASHAADTARGYASTASDTVSSTAARVSEVATEKTAKAKELVEQGKQMVAHGKEEAIQTWEHVQARAVSTSERVTHYAQEQPIVAAALAIAAGAAVGAMIPLTEAEKRYLAEPGARVTQKGRQVAGHVADAVAAKASEVVDAASAKAGEAVNEAAKAVTSEFSTSGNRSG